MAIRSAYLSEHPLCAHCQDNNKLNSATELDHITPIHKGGIDDWANYQALCSDCHKIKTAKDLGYNTAQGCNASGYPPSWHE